MTGEPFEIEIRDKTFARPGWVGNPLALTVTPRHNQQPTGSITVSASDRAAVLLQAPGARVRIRYRGEHILGGPCRLLSSEGVGSKRTRTFQVADDFRLLSRMLLWQVPGAPITGQSAAEYHTVTGPAETVVKTLVGAGAARLGLPVTIAPDLGRGSTITASARMSTPADLLLPLVDQAGIGVSVVQDGSGFVVDCYEPVDWPHVLSEAKGSLTEQSWSRQPPEVTRVVVGADGDGVARTYRHYVDSTRESEWGDVIETFVDARDIKSTDPDFEALMAARGAAALAAGAMKTGLALKLGETRVFRYGGQGVHVGDRLTIDLSGGVTVTEVLREATLSWAPDGLDVTPVIGEIRDDPTATLGRAISALARQQRTQTSRS